MTASALRCGANTRNERQSYFPKIAGETEFIPLPLDPALASP